MQKYIVFIFLINFINSSGTAYDMRSSKNKSKRRTEQKNRSSKFWVSWQKNPNNTSHLHTSTYVFIQRKKR